MWLWLGLRRVGDRAGLLQVFSRAVWPVVRALFPDIPPDGPALGAPAMNIGGKLPGKGSGAPPSV